MPPFRPMLLSPANTLPSGPGWVYEPKVDGFRMVLVRRSNALRLISRHGKDWTAWFPEFDALAYGPDLILDGELVVLAPDGRPDFDLLQQRSNRSLPHVQARKHPASYYAFDIVSLDDLDLCHLPWEQRHTILECQDLAGHHAQLARILPHTLDGEAMHRLTREMGYEGTCAKRSKSRYQPGRRTRYWTKTKHRRTEWFEVLGWRPPSSRSPGGLVVAERGEVVGVAMVNVPAEDRQALMDLVIKYGRPHPTGMLTLPAGLLEAVVSYTERTVAGL